MITKETLDKLLQETDWLYSDDVKEAVSNLSDFIAYRKLLRYHRMNVDSPDESTSLPTKPTIVWDMLKLEGVE